MIFSNNRLGKFIRNGRLDLKLTQEQLAEKLQPVLFGQCGTWEAYTELEAILQDYPDP